MTDCWKALSADAIVLEQNTSPALLLDMALWPASPPKWWQITTKKFEKFIRQLGKISERSGAKNDWLIWLEWYKSIAAGKSSFGLPNPIADELDENIALGFRINDFWSSDPIIINAEIANWVEEAKFTATSPNVPKTPVFISYTGIDAENAKSIGKVLDEENYQVFAQFKDMPPGSNFVTEMQNGLSLMGKFVPLYSPEYLKSDHSQAEWNAAYNLDPLGKRRLIIGFLLRPTGLLPLQKQCIYVPLYGLTETKARQSILEALRSSGAQKSIAASRKDAASMTSPEAILDVKGRLAISSLNELDQPFIDEEIARIPDALRRIITNICAALGEANAPTMLKQNLSDYSDELTVNESSPYIAELIRMVEIITSEVSDAEQYGAGWYRGGIRTAIEQFFELHEKLRQHYPIVMFRDLCIQQSALDAKSFDDTAFAKNNAQLTASAVAMAREDLATDEVRRIIERRERQRRDIASLREPENGQEFVQGSGRVLLADIKKRFLFDQGGMVDKILERTESATRILESESGKTLLAAAKKIARLLWGS